MKKSTKYKSNKYTGVAALSNRWMGAILILCIAAPLHAIDLKVSNIAPKNSPWGKVLEKIGSRWETVSQGEVTWRIFHNSVAGNEKDVLRKMRLGQIHIGAFTSLGIGEISPEILTLSVPGLISNDEEMSFILSEVGPSLEQKINRGRFELIGWTIAGWLYPFGTTQIRTVDDFKKLRLASTNTNQSLVQLLRKMGFNPVVLDFSEWLSGLNSGLVNGFLASPLAAAGFQWFGIANHMTDVRLSPFVGALIISDQAWTKIPRNLRAQLKQVSRQELMAFSQESTQIDQSAIETMTKNGLVIATLNEREKDTWIGQLTGKDSAPIRQAIFETFDRETFLEIENALNEFHKNQ